MSTPQRFLSVSDLASLPEPEWMIEGVFERNALVMLAGPSYSFKSFLALDWLLHMAVGRSWNGRYTRPSKVLYILGEGKSGLLKRIRAWVIFNRLSEAEKALLDSNFKVSFDVVQLADDDSTTKLLDDLNAEDFGPDVIAIDTFARSAVGLDENDAKDSGMWINNADKLRQLGYTVLFLHHTKKNTEFGHQYRGSTAIMGAMDTAITLTRDHNMCKMNVTKQKDNDEGPDLKFRRLLIDIGKGQSSCVLQLLSTPAPTAGPVDVESAVAPARIKKVSVREAARDLAEREGISEEAARSRLTRKTGATVELHHPENAPKVVHPEDVEE